MSKFNEWHLRDADAVASQLKTDISVGLSSAEVKKRRKKNGRNTVWYMSELSGGYKGATGDLSAALLAIVAVITSIINSSYYGVGICAILLIGVFMRISAYTDSARTLERSVGEGIPGALVVRDGVTVSVRADEIVEGDIIILEQGDTVPCDGRIFTDGSVKLSERGITGNRDAVLKKNTVIIADNGTDVPCEFRANMLFAGSVVLRGRCRMIATSCGDDTLVSMKYGGIEVRGGRSIPETERLTLQCRKLSLIICGIILLNCIISMVLRHGNYSLTDVFTDTLALGVSCTAAYMGVLGQFTLTLPFRQGRKNRYASVVKDFYSMEKIADTRCFLLSGVDMVKSGKTTFTSYYANGKITDVRGRDTDAEKLLSLALATEHKGDISGGLAKDGSGDFRGVLGRGAEEYYKNRTGAKPLQYKVIDGAVNGGAFGKIRNILVAEDGRCILKLSGNVRDVLAMCTLFVKNGEEYSLGPGERDRILSAASAVEVGGGVVIALAERVSEYVTLNRLTAMQNNMSFLGFLAFEEMPESDLPLSLDYFGEEKPKCILLTDNPYADMRYMCRVGLFDGSERIIPFDKLDGSALPEGGFAVTVPAMSENREKIDESAKVRHAVSKKIGELKDNLTVVVSKPSETAMITERTIGAAVSTRRDKPVSQTLSRKAKMIIYPSEGDGCGGFAGTLSTVAESRCALDNLKTAVNLTVMFFVVRAVVLLASVVMGISLIDADGLLVGGLILDVLAVMTVSFRKPGKGVLSGKTDNTPKKLIMYVIQGLIIGALSVVIPMIFGGIFGKSASDMGASVTSSVLLAEATSLAIFVLEDRKKHRAVTPPLYFTVISALTVSLCILFVPSVSELFGYGTKGGIACVSVIVSAVLTGIITTIFSKTLIKKEHR